eukprot:COSAG04_NODE_9406_length_867_cov_1.036458_1_plen_194_part_01
MSTDAPAKAATGPRPRISIGRRQPRKQLATRAARRSAPAAAGRSMAQPPPKRHKPAAAPHQQTHVDEVAALDAQLAPLKGQAQDELERKRGEMERRHAEEWAVLGKEQAELDGRIAPLQAQRDRLGGYLQLVAREIWPIYRIHGWSPADGDVCDSPLTLLEAARQRLAIAGIGNARLGAASGLSSDIAGVVGRH